MGYPASFAASHERVSDVTPSHLLCDNDKDTFFETILFVQTCVLIPSGRTHQIRLHLRKLGFPIENDPNYGELQAGDARL